MHLKISDLPKSVVQQYNLKEKSTKDMYIHLEIKRVMYGLPQVGLIAQQLLEKLLNKKGCKQRNITQGFQTHDWCLIFSALFIDDFGVKYVSKQHADHLMTVLRKYYKISRDWRGKRYLDLDLDWDYDNHKVHLSILGYVAEALTTFQHKHPHKRQDQPYPHTKPKYGVKDQYVEATYKSPPFSK